MNKNIKRINQILVKALFIAIKITYFTYYIYYYFEYYFEYFEYYSFEY